MPHFLQQYIEIEPYVYHAQYQDMLEEKVENAISAF